MDRHIKGGVSSCTQRVGINWYGLQYYTKVLQTTRKESGLQRGNYTRMGGRKTIICVVGEREKITFLWFHYEVIEFQDDV